MCGFKNLGNLFKVRNIKKNIEFSQNLNEFLEFSDIFSVKGLFQPATSCVRDQDVSLPWSQQETGKTECL